MTEQNTKKLNDTKNNSNISPNIILENAIQTSIYTQGNTTQREASLENKDVDTINLIAQSLLRLESPSEVATMTLQEKLLLANDIRSTLINVVSKNGGHLAPSLGVVELTIALLAIFNPVKDHIVWDVGHQSYAWKLLTGRAKNFDTLRTFGGIAGYPKIKEAPLYDRFGVGHASTSISVALGLAMARDLNGTNEQSIAIIGDGALTGGMAFEALNQAGGLDKKMIVILNDNGMSISNNVGALSQFLSRNLSKQSYLRFRDKTGNFLKSIPKVGNFLHRTAIYGEKSFKTFFTQGMLFEAFHFHYIGPVDGHDIEQLERHLKMAKDIDKPVLLHVRTKKGNGYAPAENNPSRFHRTPCFEPETGLVLPPPASDKPKGPGFTKTFGSTLCTLASIDKRIIAITAAMPDGTGLAEFRQKFPDRFIDAGICEAHATTFAAGMASRGYKPVVAIYSSFMQRAYDQIIHDVCIQNLPVVFCLDRAGLVGEDGPTHHGSSDLTFMRSIPNMHVIAPRDEADLKNALYTALKLDVPIALRYPPFPSDAEVHVSEDFQQLTVGVGEMLIEPQIKDLCVISIGHRAHTNFAAIKALMEEGKHNIGLFDARWVSPLPEAHILEIAKTYKGLLIIEENTRAGGFSSAILEFLSDNNALQNLRIKRVGLPEDSFVEHGSVAQLRQECGFDKANIQRTILDFWQELQK